MGMRVRVRARVGVGVRVRVRVRRRTQGMRAHMGMSAKLSVVEGIQIFHSAARSSVMLPTYCLTAPT